MLAIICVILPYVNARQRQILKTATTKRIWNLFLLKASYHISAILRRPIHWGKPMAISIEPTTACNLNCPQCPSGLRQFTRPTGNLNTTVNTRILDEVGSQLQYLNYYFQGEPFIHPQFLDLVKEARSRNIYVVTSTNAHFISPEKAKQIVASDLSEIIISIDGMKQESYEKYRVKGQLEKVIEGTKNLIAAKKELKRTNPHVVFQFLVVKYNENEIDKLHQLAKELGVDEVRLKTVQVYDFKTGNDLLPTNEKYSRYKQLKSGEYVLKNQFKNKCWRMWSSCVFTWDGSVVPCCFDKDAQHKMGTVTQTSFDQIWREGIYQSFRQDILKTREEIEICKNCSEGSKVWV